MTQDNNQRLLENLSQKIDDTIAKRLEHNQPSPKTMELFNTMQSKIIAMETKITNIEDKLDKIPTRDETELMNERLMNKVLECADKRYASKLTQNIVYALLVVIFLGATGFIWYLIQTKIL